MPTVGEPNTNYHATAGGLTVPCKTQCTLLLYHHVKLATVNAPKLCIA